ncbi:MAG: RNA 2',3'-cyclic phosphodiesterase [Desulfurella sp.]
MRAFVAIELPQNIKDKLNLLMERLPKSSGIKFTKIENLHITVKFLGELLESNIETIAKFLENIASKHKKFDIRLDNSGVFKSLKDPRIFWVGQDNNIDFLNIASSLDALFTKENHVCHITLARLKTAQIFQVKNLIEIANNFLSQNTLNFSVEEFCLFESILKSPAPVYKQIKKFKLKA